MAHLSRWLEERGLDGSAVRTLLKEFITDRRTDGAAMGCHCRRCDR
ncbi:hypothetical protein ACIBO2_28950 [Nonomuraea sp. NPDC050022]